MAKKSTKVDDAYAEALRRIEACRKEKSLAFYEMGLTAVPAAIGQLSALKELYLHGNQLTTVPLEVGKLRALTILYLAENQLKKLPSVIGQLTALTKLYLERNQITMLPPEIGQLTALTTLDVHNNQLTTVPAEIGQLTALTTLDLGFNRLTTLPPEIRQLTDLKELYLHGNPALDLPMDVLGPTREQVSDGGAKPKKPRAILDYYFTRQASGEKPLNEFKLILVGHGAVGKTTLVNQLVRGEFTQPDMTRGIHIEPWKVQVGSDGMTGHVWDFGGQDIMHGTHQFFLTRHPCICWSWRGAKANKTMTPSIGSRRLPALAASRRSSWC